MSAEPDDVPDVVFLSAFATSLMLQFGVVQGATSGVLSMGLVALLEWNRPEEEAGA